MKKSVLILAAACLALAATARASFVDVNAFGGFTTLTMGDFNGEMDKSAASTLTLIPAGSTVETTHVNNGLYIGADAGFAFFPIVKIGPRIEYISAGQAKLVVTTPGSTVTNTIDSSLLMAELGVSSDWGLPLSGLSVSGGLWGGWGMANGSDKYSGFNTPADGTYTLSGSGLTAEAAARLKYSIIPLLSVGLELGYRYAPISKLTADKDLPGQSDGDKKVLQKNGSTDPVAMDYSGLNVGLGVNLNF